MNTVHRLLLPAALIFGSVFAQEADAQAVQVVPCVGCSTYAKLSNGATQFAQRAPRPADGTILLMYSTSNNVSGYFRARSYMVCYTPYGATYCPPGSSGGTVAAYAEPVTLTEAQAQALDATLIAKAIGSVSIPARYGDSASSALGVDINSGLADKDAAPLHFSAFRGEFYVTLNGKDVFVKTGVTTIEVKFPDGSKVTMKLVDPLGTIRWIVVSRVDAAGNPVAEPASGSTGGGGAGTPQPPNPQPDPAFYCPAPITAHVCVVDVSATGQDCPTSGRVEIILRPCGT